MCGRVREKHGTSKPRYFEKTPIEFNGLRYYKPHYCPATRPAHELVFEFLTPDEWAKTARARFAAQKLRWHEAACIDARGRRVENETGLRRATDEDAFPIKVFRR
jgi:hypothetical protein